MMLEHHNPLHTSNISVRVDVDLSREVVSRMHPEPQHGDPWGNAFRAIEDVVSMFGTLPWYVEGLAGNQIGQEPIPHAWLETEDGWIIEVSWPTVLETPELGFYLPLRRFSMKEVLNHLNQPGAALPILNTEEAAQ